MGRDLSLDCRRVAVLSEAANVAAKLPGTGLGDNDHRFTPRDARYSAKWITDWTRLHRGDTRGDDDSFLRVADHPLWGPPTFEENAVSDNPTSVTAGLRFGADTVRYRSLVGFNAKEPLCNSDINYSAKKRPAC